MIKHREAIGEHNILDSENSNKLTALKPGEKAKIIRLDGGFGMRKRLTDLGVVPGREATVLSSHRNSPLLVKIDGTRIMIGRGMAAKIVVER
ncbi:MAG: ferrous iron transport protein A [Spirochaetia bacterium]